MGEYYVGQLVGDWPPLWATPKIGRWSTAGHWSANRLIDQPAKVIDVDFPFLNEPIDFFTLLFSISPPFDVQKMISRSFR